MGLKWATNYCSQVHYVLKLDDDVLNVKVSNIFGLNYNKTNNALAHVQDPLQIEPIRCTETMPFSMPVRDKWPRVRGKWLVSLKEYPDEWYPKYCTVHRIRPTACLQR